MIRFVPLVLVCFAVAAPTRAEDLFSEIAVESVYGATSGESSKKSGGTVLPAQRITGSGQLGKLAREAGYDPQRIDGKSVKLVVEHGQWTIPTTLRADVDRSRVTITMELAKPSKSLTKEQLIELLEIAPDAGGAHFAWDGDNGQVQLRQTASARGFTTLQLRRSLSEMAELAASRETAWYEQASAEGAAPAKPADPAPSLVGAWVASLGQGEAFALSLSADNKFALAHVKGGKTTLSKGVTQLGGGRLRLIGEKGVTIDGQVSGATENSFDFTLAGGKKLSFKKQARR